MKTQNNTVFTSDPSPVLLKRLSLRLAGEQDYARADALFAQQHYLGAAKRSGRGLLQIIEYEGRWVGLLDWGPAALKLADRDEWIGWNGRQRADRRELVVQNRRFLVLSATRMPNLASRCLSLGLKHLPSHWKQRHGFAPLLAETFTDIEQFAGTCYKAANWQACGRTKGFARHRADYYVKHDRPKKLWLYPLHKYCREILQGIELPSACAKALNPHSPERDLPLKKAQLDSLRERFSEVPDPRASNCQFRVSSLLTLIALGLLAGRKNLAEIQRYGQFFNHTQRVWLNWPRNKTGPRRKAPSYSALYNLLRQLDPHAFAEVLSEWMQAHYGDLPRALALDGKYIRDQVLTLCLSEHQSGAPVAVALAGEHPRTQDNKTDGELTVAAKLYRQTSLEGAIVTADALHGKQTVATQIVEQGGDYLLQIKDERRAVVKTARKLADTSPLLPTAPPTKHTDGSKPAI